VVGFVCGTVLWSYANSLCAKLILARVGVSLIFKELVGGSGYLVL
jgi:hypothetical protein